MEINFDKSKLWFSPIVSEENMTRILNILQIRETSDLGMYLGYLLKASYKTRDFNFIFDELNRRMQGLNQPPFKSWRMQLIRLTTSNMTNHVMEVIMLPKIILNKIDKINRNFFWGHNSNTAKLHTINYGKIT